MTNRTRCAKTAVETERWISTRIYTWRATYVRRLVVSFLVLTNLSRADVVASVGLGKAAFGGAQGTPFERAASLGYEHTFSNGLFVRPEAGWFMDNSGHGVSSPWLAPLVGVRSQSTVGPALHFAMGPGYLHNPDSVLGGHFQFSLEGGASLIDRNFGIGVVWKHLSSAGINMPNRGRDFIALQVHVPIGRTSGVERR